MTALIAPLDEHNRALLDNVHPPAHVNPTPAGRYNLVVVGAGTAGLVAAAGAAGLGARVALIERQLMGGDCLNIGCVPSKALIRAGRAVAAVRRAHAFGITPPSEPAVDFASVMERMRRLRAGISRNDSVARFRDGFGVDVFIGAGRFLRDGVVGVGDVELNYAKAVVATGARAAMLPVSGLDAAGVLTNENVFWLTERPRRLVVIGAGPIGCELGQAFRRFGSEVTLLGQEFLPREDCDAAAVVGDALRRDGVQIELVDEISAVEPRGEEKVVRFRSRGDERAIACDAILLAAGRAPNIEGLGLENVGVAFDACGVTVDDGLRTTNRRIFAAGDVCSPYQFTHAADAMARIVIRNALFFGRAKTSALTIPRCTYTEPEIAHVGLTQADAERQGIATTTFALPLADVDRAIIDDETEGFAKAVLRRGSDRVLGLTIVASHAGDMIGEAVLAMRQGVGLGRFAETIHPYPTQAEVLRKLGDVYNRTRLTPRVKRAFHTLMAWRR